MKKSRRIARRRLLKLVQRLKRVNPRHFDMYSWAISQHPCKTTGCAVGYAATIPSFQRAGLHLDKSDVPTYRGYTSWGSVRAFFHLFEDECRHLFMWRSYGIPTLKNVTQRIDAFAKQLH